MYDKELAASAQWESDFVGVVGIPAAVNEYVMLYRKLVAALLSDREFQKATQAGL